MTVVTGARLSGVESARGAHLLAPAAPSSYRGSVNHRPATVERTVNDDGRFFTFL